MFKCAHCERDFEDNKKHIIKARHNTYDYSTGSISLDLEEKEYAICDECFRNFEFDN